MAIEDFLEALGTGVNGMGLQRQPYQPALGTGVASALGGFATGMKLRRALADARRLKNARDQFSQTTGIDYDLFAKLPSDAQTQILKNKGLIDDPANHPLEQFGGRTMTQLENQGIPPQTAPAMGTGAFEGLGGLGVGDQMTGPNGVGMVPLKGVTGKARADVMQNYLNQGAPQGQPAGMTPNEYRKFRLDQLERATRSNIELNDAKRRETLQRIKYIRNNDARRSNPNAPVDDWEVDMARNMGVDIPVGVKPTRKQFDTAIKLKPQAVGAVLMRTNEMADAIHQAEVQRGVKMTDKQIQDFVAQQGADLGTIAGPSAIGIATGGVKAKLKGMRQQPDWMYKPAEDEDKTAVPDSLEEQDDAGTESDDDGGEDEGGDY